MTSIDDPNPSPSTAPAAIDPPRADRDTEPPGPARPLTPLGALLMGAERQRGAQHAGGRDRAGAHVDPDPPDPGGPHGAPGLSTTCDAIVVATQPIEAWALRDGCAGREDARLTLTAIAALARAVDATTAPELWRYRRRSTGLDVRLRVVREERLGARIAVVVAAEWGRR